MRNGELNTRPNKLTEKHRVFVSGRKRTANGINFMPDRLRPSGSISLNHTIETREE